MELVSLIIAITILGAIAYAHWRLRGAVQQVTQSIHESVALEVRRQDERIRKRVERSDGQEQDAERTVETRPLKPGDSWPGG